MENYLVSEAPRRSKASRLLTFGAGAAAGFVAVGVVYYVSMSQDDTSTVAVADPKSTNNECMMGSLPSCTAGKWSRAGCMEGKCCLGKKLRSCNYNSWGDDEEDDVVEDVESDADDDVSVLAQEATAMKRSSMMKPAPKAMKKRSMRKAMKKDDDEEEVELQALDFGDGFGHGFIDPTPPDDGPCAVCADEEDDYR